MKKFILFVLIILSTTGTTQNLVPNPSFDFFTTCPNNQAQVAFAPPWFMPSTGTSDYYHTCSSPASWVNIPGPNQIGYSSSYAHTGSGMAGLWHSANVKHDMSLPGGECGYREYVAVRLNSALVNNSIYYVTFYVKLADSCIYAGNVSMLISKDSIFKSKFDTIAATPQINNVSNTFIKSKTQWTKISGSFVANGTEKFIYIGNFKPTITTDTFFVGPGGRAPSGYPGGYKLNDAYYYIDDVCVSPNSNFCNIWTDFQDVSYRPFQIFPNPNAGRMKIKSENSNLSSMEIINIQGRSILTFPVVDQNEIDIDCSSLPIGMYFLKIIQNNRTFYERFIKQ